MIILLTFGAVVGVAVYFATFKLQQKWRFLSAVTAFLLLGVLPIIWVLVIGDQMPPDARLVTEDELRQGTKRAP